MHRLVQSQCEEALPVGGELPLPSFGRRLSRLVEVLFAQGLQKLRILLAQLLVLLSNLDEWRIGARIRNGFGVLTKVLMPLCRGILGSEKYGRNHALDQRKMAQNPQRVAPSIRRGKCRCGAAHLVDYAQHCSIRNGHCELNSVFREHFFLLELHAHSILRLWSGPRYVQQNSQEGSFRKDRSL